MEEDTVELIDYFRVIWKRKILIIVGTIACMVAGVVVSLRLPVKYHSVAVMKIGKKVELGVPSTALSSSTSSLILFDNPADIAKSIPVKFGQSIRGNPRFHLDAEVVGQTSMIRVILKGPDRRTEKFLKEIVNKLIDEHNRMAEASISQFKNFTDKLRAEAKEIRDDIAVTEEKLKEAKSIEQEIQGDIAVTERSTGDAKSLDIKLALMQMSYLRTLDKEKDLKQSWRSLRDVKRQLIMYRTFVDSLKEYNTEMIGEVENTAIEPKKKRNIILAGVVGLIMFLFLAFFIEYLGRVREKGNDSF